MDPATFKAIDTWDAPVTLAGPDSNVLNVRQTVELDFATTMVPVTAAVLTTPGNTAWSEPVRETAAKMASAV